MNNHSFMAWNADFDAPSCLRSWPSNGRMAAACRIAPVPGVGAWYAWTWERFGSRERPSRPAPWQQLFGDEVWNKNWGISCGMLCLGRENQTNMHVHNFQPGKFKIDKQCWLARTCWLVSFVGRVQHRLISGSLCVCVCQYKGNSTTPLYMAGNGNGMKWRRSFCWSLLMTILKKYLMAQSAMTDQWHHS